MKNKSLLLYKPYFNRGLVFAKLRANDLLNLNFSPSGCNIYLISISKSLRSGIKLNQKTKA